jgi:hypothetical protein
MPRLLVVQSFCFCWLILVTTCRADDNSDSESSSQRTLLSRQSRIQDDEMRAIRVLQDLDSLDKHPKAAFFALKFLEAIRSTKAIPVLCDRLIYEQRFEAFRSPVGDRQTYPASAVLVAVGRPAIDGLLLKISTSETDIQYREVARGVISEIVGRDRVIELIDRFAATQRDSRTPAHQEAFKNFDPAKLEKFKAEARFKLK